jgi:hypothetical protein
MVFINLKLGEKNQFLYETTCQERVDDVIKDLVIGKEC